MGWDGIMPGAKSYAQDTRRERGGRIVEDKRDNAVT